MSREGVCVRSDSYLTPQFSADRHREEEKLDKVKDDCNTQRVTLTQQPACMTRCEVSA